AHEPQRGGLVLMHQPPRRSGNDSSRDRPRIQAVSNKNHHPGEWPEPANTTSTRMLAGARSDDPNSWEHIVRLYAPLLHWWCRQGLRPWGDIPGLPPVPGQAAADVGQEVFLTVFKRISRFTKDGKPAAFRRWLYAITNYKVLEYWTDPAREFD